MSQYLSTLGYRHFCPEDQLAPYIKRYFISDHFLWFKNHGLTKLMSWQSLHCGAVQKKPLLIIITVQVCSKGAQNIIIIIIIIIIRFLMNVQVQGQYLHQWVPFQVDGLLHAWQISHQICRCLYHEGLDDS